MESGKRKSTQRRREEELKRTSVEASLEASASADNDDDDDGVPVRNCSSLYTSQVTLHCALYRHCVPCSYKVGSFDVALDEDFCRAIPNQRPEQCPRAKQEQTAKKANSTLGITEGTLGYRRDMAIMTVGDGDFTFSLAIARLLNGKTHSDSLVATSYESKASLIQVYPGIKQTISELESLGATVCFQVDATRLKETLPETIKGSNTFQFDRIVWNFPCSAVEKGQDGQNEEMENNKTLVKDFVANSRHLLKAQGQIHLNHKTKPPFNQWNIEEVAVESLQDDNNKDGANVYYLGRVVLDRFLYPPYVPRKALHHKSFPAHDACTYIFGLKQEGASALATNVIDFDKSKDTSIEPSASTLVRVTPNLIRLLRSSFINDRDMYKRVNTGKATKRQKR
jgi:25S rRNA (uracil2634-N3)-methyltransferase